MMDTTAARHRLTGKQEQFITAYLGVARANATEAARVAGYRGSDVALSVIGHQNLSKPAIRAVIDAANERLRTSGIAIKQSRIDAADDRHRRLQAVIDERALFFANSTVPGASTGLLVHTRRTIGTGQNAVTIDEYTLDAALLKEMRELEKQIAQEVGDWTVNQKIEHTGALTFVDLFTIATSEESQEDD